MNTDSFVIEGNGGAKTLEGSVAISGAKNAVLKAMAAALLFSDEVTIENVPAIEDVERMKELLSTLGASVGGVGTRLTIAAPLHSDGALGPAAKRMRASIVLSGPLLARYGRVAFPHPGGCVIGPRAIDQFLNAYKKMGASVREENNEYVIEAPKEGLSGADIFLSIVSVTATETIMMTAVRVKGTTRIKNAAMEPEISELANFLNRCGANIRGAGTPFIDIEGVPELVADGARYETIPDRIETGSFLILGALAAKELVITDCVPEHIGILIELLRTAGVPLEIEEHTITVRGGNSYKAVDIHTHEYPGFATDLQAPMTVFLTQAEGTSRVFETIFRERLAYTEDLNLMGANITLWNRHEAEIRGPKPLKGRDLAAPDLRAGLAFIIAALIAEGRSTINNAYYIDRGYEHIDSRLHALGASITRY